MATKAEIEAELAALQAKHEKFRQDVWDTAMRYAEEHEMCTVVEKALAEVGLRAPKRTATVTIEIPDLSKFFERFEYVVGRDDSENAGDLADLINEKLTAYSGVAAVEATVEQA